MQRFNDYICIDLETTGLSVKKREIIEFAAIRVKNGKIVESMQTLIRPKFKLEEKVTKLTGITDDMLMDKPYIDEVLADLINFIGKDILLGHNILFDYSFLKKAAIDLNINFGAKGIDTFHICKYLLPNDISKSLESACRYYDINVDLSHRAYADAYNTHLLYQKLILLEACDKIFEARQLKFKYKKERLATNKEKEYLIKLLNYHRIELDFDVDKLRISDLARIKDKIILNYGKINRRK